jgi:inhibitor of cysteine peptidase
MKTRYLCGCILLFVSSLASAQDSKPIAVTIGQEFSVSLASNPTTGFKWDLATPLNTNLLTLITNEYVRPNSALMGAGGNEVWKFKAVGEGKADIDLKYARPWEKAVQPAKKTNFVVVVSGPRAAK